MLSEYDLQRDVLLPVGDVRHGSGLVPMRHTQQLVELVCEGVCNKQLPAYDAMVDQAAHIRSHSQDHGRAALVEFGAPAWQTVRAVYTTHYKVDREWRCVTCGNMRKWGEP